jgi:spermidine synthase
MSRLPQPETVERTKDSPTKESNRYALYIAFFLSGAAALGYQILWAKMFALTLGHEFPAVIAVVVAFFAGIAIGSAFANRILERFGSNAFSRLELLIGGFAILSPRLILKLGADRLSIIAILPCTIAMGATLPAMATLARIPAAYAANTLGAVIGCLGAAYFLMPHFGLVVPIFVFAVANFIASYLGRNFVSKPTEGYRSLAAPLAIIFFATGFVGLGFETLGIRLLSLSLENTVFTFAAVLAVYLLGQSTGAALLRFKPIHLGILLTVTIVLSLWLFTVSGALYENLRHAFGDSGFAVFAAELLTALAVFALPTFFMGGLFAQLANRAGQGALGTALVWNSAGAAIGALVVPMFLLSNLSSFKSLVRVQPGSTLRDVRQGRMATVFVMQTPDGNRTLFVNNRFQMGGTAATIPELRHADIPLLLHPNPHRALVLGLGTGITLSACATFPNLRADGVELLPEVVAVMPNFFPNPADSPLNATNISIHIADARRFIRETTNRYDVVIADLFHPAQDGSGFLYTREHFRRIRSRLASDGLFCQWLPLHQLDLNTFRDITRTFLDVFPNGEAWLLRPNIDAPVVGLIGYKSNRPEFTTNLVEARLTDSRLAAQLHHVALADSIRLFGSFLAGPSALNAFVGEGRLNTDTFPIVMFEAPAFSYRRNAPTHERLMAFLRQISQRVPPIADPTLRDKVSRYIKARDVYLEALVAESEHGRDKAIAGYIESARISEDFTSGYAQCLAIATAEAKSNPALARDILQRLVAAQPNRPVAKELLDRLDRLQ